MAQKGIYRGIYEFEDPSGGLLASKVPSHGSADLYDGTVVIVRPNQRAIFVYNGRITDTLKPGSHKLKTGNLPVLTKLANWRFGFKSPLRCEVWFFSGNTHTSRRWGTSSPVMSNFNSVGTIPIRAFGTYNVSSRNPKKMFNNLIGSKNFLDISEVENFLQAQLVELLPEALTIVTEISDLSKMQDEVSIQLEKLCKTKLSEYGLNIKNIQIQSLLPPDEVMEALETRVAMNIIGNQKKYLMYKAASSLEDLNDGGEGSPMQMMMGLMLGKGLMGYEEAETETKPSRLTSPRGNLKCHGCKTNLVPAANFCHMCGEKV